MLAPLGVIDEQRDVACLLPTALMKDEDTKLSHDK